MILGSTDGFSANQMSQGALAKLESTSQAEIYFKNSKAFIFSQIKSNQELKIRDSIFVGPQSQAKLKFSKDYGGGIILLGPNTIVTLIQMGKANDIPTIELKQGTVKMLQAPEDEKKIVLVTHDLKAVVLNASLESSEVSVSSEEKLVINPVGIPAKNTDPSPQPAVFDLAKIQNLDPKPLEEFIHDTTKTPLSLPIIKDAPPVVAIKSKPKIKSKPQNKVEPIQAPVEQKIEMPVTKSEPAPSEPISSNKSSNLTSHLLAFAGLSYMNYTQTASPSINELVLTFRATHRLSFSKVFDVGLSGEVSALPLVSSDGIKLRFYRANINAGFTPLATSKWRLTMYPGIYFSTTKASGFIIGYSELYEAELSTLIERTFSSDNRLGLSLRFASVLNSTSLGFENREVGLGVSYSFAPNLKKRYVSIQSDYTMLKVSINTIQVSSNVVCFGASYHW